jgi:hypothetical protein
VKLERIYGFLGAAVSFIESYLSGRFQCVCAGLFFVLVYFLSCFLYLLTISVGPFEHPITICMRMMCNYIRAIDTKICRNVLRDSMGLGGRTTLVDGEWLVAKTQNYDNMQTSWSAAFSVCGWVDVSFHTAVA